jgi:hypothetical protein
MLRLATLSSFLLFGNAYGDASTPSDAAVLMADDDDRTDQKRVRVSFRGTDNESGIDGYYVCGCDGQGNLSTPGGADCSAKVDPKGQTKDVSGSGDISTSYNRTTGILTISNRGGYGSNEAGTVSLTGPGTLYTIHLDVEPRDDYIKISNDKDGNEVVLTGNYSACLRTRTSLEGIYMDKNLAPGQHYSESFDDYHTTEETQNHQDDLCHNVLTGKILMPAPVEIGLLSHQQCRRRCRP